MFLVKVEFVSVDNDVYRVPQEIWFMFLWSHHMQIVYSHKNQKHFMSGNRLQNIFHDMQSMHQICIHVDM